MANLQTVMVLAPHTDDGEFGCGGTIAKFISEGKDVYYVAFSTAEDSLPPDMPKNTLEREVREATKRLGIPVSHLIVYGFQVRKLNYIRQDILAYLSSQWARHSSAPYSPLQ